MLDTTRYDKITISFSLRSIRNFIFRFLFIFPSHELSHEDINELINCQAKNKMGTFNNYSCSVKFSDMEPGQLLITQANHLTIITLLCEPYDFVIAPEQQQQ